MIYTNKIVTLFFLICISSCGAIDLGYVAVIKESFSNDNVIDIAKAQDSPYSYLIIRQGKREAIFVLSEYDRETQFEKWIGAQGEILKTFKGIIIETQGLDSNFKFSFNTKNINKHLEKGLFFFINYDNPPAFFLESEISIMNISKTSICNQKISYKFKVITIKHDDVIEVCLDQQGLAKFSKQKNHPHDKQYLIDFYYK